jgi:uncharacterized protein YcaQ
MAAAVRTKRPRIEAVEARRLLLLGQDLLSDPARPATPAAVCRRIEHMGFVQVDTINTVQRAHDHILSSRFDDYEPRMLAKLLERDRKLFEHWTHDASIVPVRWLPWWTRRFHRYRLRGAEPDTWWRRQMGPDADRIIAEVRGRIEREGPRMSKDFEHDRKGRPSSWWGWKPQKAALDHLWKIGDLTVSRRVNFHKVYDLTARVFPETTAMETPEEEPHVEWACRAALDRLGVATPTELARFLAAIDVKAATAWCRSAEAAGEITEVEVKPFGDGPVRAAYAVPDWRRRLGRAPRPPRRIRLLSPFDPVIRDRDRAARLFGFEYRFEAFVPAAKRRYGYYVLPLLEEDRLVGRVDPKFHRDRGELEIKQVWWEPGVKATAPRRRALEEAVNLLACQIGAETWVMEWG